MISTAERLDVRTDPTLEELRFMFRRCRARRRRTMAQFAEQEIILPDGKFKNSRLKLDRQPYARAFFDAIDSGRYNVIAATGPTQSGKTLHCSMVPLLYHLFEIGETVVFGIPDMKMADDKWQIDILPVLMKTRFRDLLPTKGEGSRGGAVKNRVVFQNGAVLKFMSGGGGDKSRAGFTSRVLVVTEVDGFGDSGEASEEASKLDQLIGRTLHFGKDARIYLECTVTTEMGPIWQEYISGTESQLLKPCPACGEYVAPERDELQGWQTADSSTTARLSAAFACPRCSEEFTEADRRAMNLAAKLVHRGQSIDREGVISGDHPETDTLGFRWSGFDNQFLTMADFAEMLWKSSRSPDEENEERKQSQFIWCRPYKAPIDKIVMLAPITMQTRQHSLPQGLFPIDGEILGVGADVGAHVLHWHAIAADGPFRCRSVNYGEIPVLSQSYGIENAILVALRELRDFLEAGFAWQGHSEPRTPDIVLIDAGYKQGTVMQFVGECNSMEETAERYWAGKGFGFGQLAGTSYSMPTKSNLTRMLGDNYHIQMIEGEEGGPLLEFSSDFWKSFLHTRLTIGKDEPSAMTFFAAIPKVHKEICKQLCAEEQQLEFDLLKGERLVWKRKSRVNHYLDATSMACIAAHMAGARLIHVPIERSPAPPIANFTNHDGRAFVALDR